jgi:hypothetical protein
MSNDNQKARLAAVRMRKRRRLSTALFTTLTVTWSPANAQQPPGSSLVCKVGSGLIFHSKLRVVTRPQPPGKGPPDILVKCQTPTVGCTASGFPKSNDCSQGPYGSLWVVPNPAGQLKLVGSCSSVETKGNQSFSVKCINVNATSFYCDYNANGPYFGSRASVSGYCYQYGYAPF